MENDDSMEHAQSPSARVAHHGSGENAAVAPGKPAASTRPAVAVLATSGTTIAPFFVRPQTNPAAPALRQQL